MLEVGTWIPSHVLHVSMPGAARGPASVLVPGCGNSALGPQLAAAGYGLITCVDYVPGVIEDMAQLHGCAAIPRYAPLRGPARCRYIALSKCSPGVRYKVLWTKQLA